MKLQNKVLLVAMVSLLAGCSSVKKELGIDRNSPDEFMVVKRAPLTLPPDYSLRPPAPADAQPASDAVATAETALMGEEKKAPTAAKAADSAFLDKMGANADNSEIRRKINEDNGYLSLENRSLADKLIEWKDGDDAPVTKDHQPESTVDATAEAARLKKNKEEGKPLNDGDVPVIKKSTSTFDKIF